MFIYIVWGIFTLLNLFNRLLLPQLFSRYPFNSFSRPFLNFIDSPYYKHYISICDLLMIYVFSPLSIAFLIQLSQFSEIGFPRAFESVIKIFLIISLSCSINKDTLNFSFSLLLYSFSGSFKYPLFEVFIQYKSIWKIQESGQKIDYVLKHLSFYSLTSKYEIIVLLAMFANFQFIMFIF
jgi:hypothetical protein